jgi:ATP-binding protein involved in chromosome partitioning
MFQKVNVPILGVAENMSHFLDPSGQKHLLFGSGGGIATAERLGAPFMGEVPLAQDIREGGDKGVPVVVGDPGGAVARVFTAMAESLLATLEKAASRPM